jgi:cytochrome c5
MSALTDIDGMTLRAIFLATVLSALPGCNRGSGAAGDPVVAQAPGQLTYQRFCISCHSSGVSGAPPLGNALAWAPRIAQGDATLLKHTIDGMPSSGMPPRGMCGACSDQELLDAIHFMTSRSQ